MSKHNNESSVTVDLGQPGPFENGDPSAVSVELDQTNLLNHHEHEFLALIPTSANIRQQVAALHTDYYMGIDYLLSESAGYYPSFLTDADSKVLEEAKTKATHLGVANPEVTTIVSGVSSDVSKRAIRYTMDQLVWQEAKLKAAALGDESPDVALTLSAASSENARRAMTSLLPEAVVSPQMIEDIQETVRKVSSFEETTEDVRRAVNTVLRLRSVPDQGKPRTDRDICLFVRGLLERSQKTAMEPHLKVTYLILWELMGGSLKNRLPF